VTTTPARNHGRPYSNGSAVETLPAAGCAGGGVGVVLLDGAPMTVDTCPVCLTESLTVVHITPEGVQTNECSNCPYVEEL
jgi:hypothetical protein